VIADVDATIAAWARRLLPDVEIAFTPPEEEKRADRKRDTLVVLLHSVREDLDAGSPGWTSLRNDSGVVVGRAVPTRAYRLTYLLIACAKETAGEHEMLGRLLAGSMLDDVVPPDLVAGQMKAAESPIVIRCAPAQSSVELREAWSTLWSAWGMRPRTMLELSVLAPMPPGLVQAVAEPPAEIALGVERLPSVPPVRRGEHDGLSRPTARITEGR